METNHGNSLLSVMLGIHGAPVEYVAAFTDDGTKVGESTLLSPQQTRLHFNREHIGMFDGLIKIHNHPLTDGAFSGQDFYSVFGSFYVSRNIVVTNRFVYTLEIPKECWADVYGDEIEQRYRELDGELRKEVKSLVRRTVQVCQQLAEEYGLTFRKELYIVAVWREFWRSHL